METIKEETVDQLNARIAEYLKPVPMYGRCQRCGTVQQVTPGTPCSNRDCRAGAKWTPDQKSGILDSR